MVLAEPLPRDQDFLEVDADGAFQVDPDPRPMPFNPTLGKLVLLDARSGQLIGDVGWTGVPLGPSMACFAFNIGIDLLPAARGRGFGTTGQRLLAEHLFATTDVFRIEASTDVANIAEQKALRKAGFRVEGVIRGGQLRGGRRRDLVLFSLLRTDVEQPDGKRAVLASRDGVALAEARHGDREAVHTVSDGAFGLDEDDRVSPVAPPPVGRLAVTTADVDELLGMVSWHAVGYGPGVGCASWNIGIELVPAARGRGAGTTAQRLLAEHLFATTELDRVEAGTDADNIAEQRALEKAGFRRDGVVRGAQLMGGERRDMVLYGILRSDL
ncbi:acetyltransferase (GNAT) family protein [Labedaea rhizosphaerae]|uniref:Acetyltransferase (GNAT) family protein n=1 Tax=Labedaea rhizosphaerae TaxID=598644 RepID=A0A4R6SQL1_LABRH|nr:acetyltransferase (GNAT) family protein [Labedaea rhizosphaerae]